MFAQIAQFQQPIDKQLGRLLAFVILFEKKIESLRIKLAGNQQFHSRLAFQYLDIRRKCIITPDDLIDVLNRYSSPITIGQSESFCRKYTANGSFSYDQFIKFITPKTNKILAQRLMIRTYRAGAQIPTYIVKIMFQLLSTAVNMIAVTQNLRKKIQQSTQLTHIQMLEFFKKCCSTRQKLFYFINASTEGQGQYDFDPKEMDYLCFHVRTYCDLGQISDHQIKEILCPLDMNFQKTFFNKLYSDQKNRTDYFKGQTSYGGKSQQNEISTKTVNFLKTNYRQTSNNFYQRPVQRNNVGYLSSQSYEGVEQNVQTLVPKPMNYRGNALGVAKQNDIFGRGVATNYQGIQARGQDTSQISSYDNLYIQKFTRMNPTSDNNAYSLNLNGSQSPIGGIKQLNSLLNINRNDNNNNNRSSQKRQQFFDDYYQGKDVDEYSDEVSGNNSAFLQY